MSFGPSPGAEAAIDRQVDAQREADLCKKRGYKNEAAARSALQRLAKKGRPERRMYRCRRCKKWHLTSQSARTAW